MIDFGKHFWLVGFALHLLLVGAAGLRASISVQQDPKIALGCNSLLQRRLILGSVPWAVMALGTIGGVPSVWAYFRPHDGNPYVIAWYASTAFLWILSAHWMMAKNGAEFVAAHPGLLRTRPTQPENVAAAHMFALIGGITALIGICLIDLPLG